MIATTPTTGLIAALSGSPTICAPGRPRRRLGWRLFAGDPAANKDVEIFKKTPCAADLKLAGRDVAKDMLETDGMPFHHESQEKMTGQVRVVHKAVARDQPFGSGADRSVRAGEQSCDADV